MMNMQSMMKQAQKLQKQMEKGQAELAATEFVGKSAQDLVVATLTGDKKVVKSQKTHPLLIQLRGGYFM